LPVALGYQWTGTKVYTSILNLWDWRNWVVNGTFDTGRNTPYPPISRPWTFRTYPGTGDATIDTGNWVGSGSKYVNVSMPWISFGRNPPGRSYYQGEYVAWNETFIVPRGTVLAANLSLAYHPNYVVRLAYSDWKVFVQVNSRTVWSRDFAAMNTTGERNNWNHLVNEDVLRDINGQLVFNTPTKQNISISVGVLYSGPSGWFWDNLATSQNGCWFDNVTLALKALAKPEQIKLKLTAPGLPNTNSSINSPSPLSYGSGNGTLTGFTIGPAPAAQTIYYLDFISNVTNPVSGSFKANATIYTLRKQYIPTTFDNQEVKVNWHFPVVTYFQLNGQGLGTTFYSKYYFNTSVPSSWNYTNCVDPSGTPHSIPSTNFDQFTVGSAKILRVNVTNIGIYSTGSNGFAPYQINAQSDNYVKQVFLQKFNSTSGKWQNETSSFKPNEYMRVVAFIASPGGVRSNSGMANITSWYGTPATTWKPVNSTTPANGCANFTFPLTSTLAHASNYTVVVSWLNQTSGETQAGTGSTVFIITRIAEIKSYAPAQLTRIAQDEYFTVSISVVDQLDQTAIQGALAQYTVAWKGGPQTMSWNSLGQNYTSQPQERMPQTAHGLRWVNLTASKQYYNTLSVNISVYAILATQAAPQNQIQTIYWGTSWYNFSINYYGVNPPNNTAVTGASVTCQTSFWQSRTYVSEAVAGTYDVSIYSEGVLEATYPIAFLIAKLGSDWQPQAFFTTLIINPIPTSALGSFIPTEHGDLVADSLTVTSGQIATMLFSYIDTGGHPISNASLIFTADFGGGSLSEVSGRPGYYILNVTTGSITATSHGIHVTAQKAHYATQTKDVTFSITPQGLPVWLLVGGSLGSAGIVVGIFGAYWYIRRARIPFMIKKIDESLKLISKGEHEAARPVALKSREELIMGITQDRLDAFAARRSTVSEVAAEERAESTTAAGTAEAGALKQELEASESHEKPGEVIEEVEMDTLDEELQKLEKSEEKEKLPDGAKEVRDVIEKYKEGKKKR
jgi:hypothetical protein